MRASQLRKLRAAEDEYERTHSASRPGGLTYKNAQAAARRAGARLAAVRRNSTPDEIAADRRIWHI